MKDLLAELADDISNINIINGWFEAERTFGDEIALLHSEISEMFEAFRDNQMVTVFECQKCKHVFSRTHEEYDPKMPHIEIYGDRGPDFECAAPDLKPIGVPAEAADELIRLLDFCFRYKIDLLAETRTKMKHNITRGHHHGGKAI